jgi:hypothetical protein
MSARGKMPPKDSISRKPVAMTTCNSSRMVNRAVLSSGRVGGGEVETAAVLGDA